MGVGRRFSGRLPRIVGGGWRLDARAAARALGGGRRSGRAAALVCAVGVGVATAAFALADPFTLRALPFANPHELVVITARADGPGAGHPAPTTGAWRARTDLFQRLAAHERGRMERVGTSRGLALLHVRDVSPDFFEVLGVPGPAADAWRAGEPSLVLTPAGRQALGFGNGDVPPTLARPDGVTFHVAGVLADAFLFPEAGGASLVHGVTPYAPGTIGGAAWQPGSGPVLVGRLQPGVTADAARAALAATAPGLAIQVDPLPGRMTRAMRPRALGALAAALLFLLITAANLANLATAGAVARAGEAATRRALGATAADLARLWAFEWAAVGLAGVALGLAVAWALLQAAAHVIPPEFVSLGPPAITWRAVGCAAAAGLALALSAFVPALSAARVAAAGLSIRASAPGTPRQRGLRVTVAALQAGLAVVAAVAGAFMIRTSIHLVRQDVGYGAAVAASAVSFPAGRPRGQVYDDVHASLEAIRRIPGVLAAGATPGPIVNNSVSAVMIAAGGPPRPMDATFVTAGFFEAAGLTLVEGRALTPRDTGLRGVVVNELAARALWSDRSALGRILRVADRPAEVVGVVRPVFDRRLDARPTPTLYALLDRSQGFPNVVVVTRTAGDPAAIREPVRRAIAAVNPQAVVHPPERLHSRLLDTVRDRTFAAFALALLGVAAGTVTVAGLIGLVSFLLARRTREIGIRLALGAGRAHVRRLVAGEAIAAAAAGGLGGLIAGRWLSLSLGSLVYGVEPGDWTTAIAAAAATVVLMGGASLAAAGQALRLAPADALRVE